MSRGAKDELQEILHDPNVGIDVAERKAKLAEAKKVIRIVNIIAVMMGISVTVSMATMKAYDIAIIVALLFPVIPVCIFARYKHLVNLHEHQKSHVKPTIDTAFIVSPLILFIISIAKYDLVNYWLCILPVCVIYLIFAGVFYLILPEKIKREDSYGHFIMAIFMLPYCYGSTVIINCNYDNSEETHYQTIVKGKYVVPGKGTSYHLQLQEWGPKTKQNEIRVSAYTYNLMNEGQQITIALRTGLLHIPWYYLIQ